MIPSITFYPARCATPPDTGFLLSVFFSSSFRKIIYGFRSHLQAQGERFLGRVKLVGMQHPPRFATRRMHARKSAGASWQWQMCQPPPLFTTTTLPFRLISRFTSNAGQACRASSYRAKLEFNLRGKYNQKKNPKFAWKLPHCRYAFASSN